MNPIACPLCGCVDWRTSWSGHFYEEITLNWQRHVAKPQYDLGFDNEDQYDTDTERWACAGCNAPADDEIQDALAAIYQT